MNLIVNFVYFIFVFVGSLLLLRRRQSISFLYLSTSSYVTVTRTNIVIEWSFGCNINSSTYYHLIVFRFLFSSCFSWIENYSYVIIQFFQCPYFKSNEKYRSLNKLPRFVSLWFELNKIFCESTELFSPNCSIRLCSDACGTHDYIYLILRLLSLSLFLYQPLFDYYQYYHLNWVRLNVHDLSNEWNAPSKVRTNKKKMLKKTNEKQIRLYENVLYPTSWLLFQFAKAS